MGDIVWAPSPQRAAGTRLAAFAGGAPTTPAAYRELHRWSVEDLEGFWSRVWATTGVVASRPAEAVVVEPAEGILGARWFPGAELSYPAHLLRRRDDGLAVVAAGEGVDDERVTWADLAGRVGRAQRGLAGLGVGRGDRVAGVVPNRVEALVLMLATTSLGAVWSSCSPDFGVMAIVDRFSQITPTVLVAADGYRYAGRVHRLGDRIAAVLDALEQAGAAPRALVVLDVLGEGLAPAGGSGASGVDVVAYADLLAGADAEPAFVPLPFDHPLYVLYSSGTTGVPKSIVHGAGGTLLTHLKEHQLHCDLGPRDVVTWFTTCGWMMWNWLVSALASGATIVLYDGSPTAPDAGTLWRLASRAGVTHFGTSPRFLSACAAAGLVPSEEADLSRLRALMSTGSPLHAEQFDWVYAHVARDLHLASMSGGTDIVACFAGGVPTLPVRRGRLQAAALGMAAAAYDRDGHPVVGRQGELVCTRPFPSMPVGFWGDDDGARYRAAYFEGHPGVWTHGDLVEFDPDGSLAILGRSDTTLNPGGVRIGTAEIYRALETMPEVADAVVVGRRAAGDEEIVLAIVTAPGVAFDDALRQRIRAVIRAATSPRHVPAHVVGVGEVPYTRSGKKVEGAVRAVLEGRAVPNREALVNPAALDQYAQLGLPPA